MNYEIRSGASGQGFTPYGAAREFFTYKGAEALLHGPAETGKTIAALYKLHVCACKYPKASIVIARKTLSSAIGTVLQTFINKVLDKAAPVEIYGGSKPEWFDYKNGSRIWVAGLDKSSKILSAEHDIIYVNQAEELILDDWETLTTRTTGRAGNMPYSQTIGDVNPSYPGHWIYHRPSLRLFYSVHIDNPTLYDGNGNITEQGRRTMAVLEALTGARRLRLLEGKPAQAEGVIYDEWDESRHLVYADKKPELVRFVGAQDWGYNHPGVLGVWGLNNDGDMYLTAQIFRTQKTIDWWTDRAVELQNEFNLETVACDPSQPAYIAQYRRAGVMATEANNDVLVGINSVKQRLAQNRLFVVRDSIRYIDQELKDAHRPYRVEDEFPSYVWADSKGKETPVKSLDDGMDMTRYAVMYVDFDIPSDIEIVRIGG
jgi:hypothetical protein